MPFNNLEFGAFIDLEHLLTANKDNYATNLPQIFATLYRRVVKEGDSFQEPVYETYSNWPKLRSKQYYQMPITDLYGTLIDYMNFRSKLFASYEGLFAEKEDSDGEIDYTGLTSKEIDAIKNEERIAKWGWELLLLKLADKDPLKIEQATKMPIIQALNILSMHQELKLGEKS